MVVFTISVPKAFTLFYMFALRKGLFVGKRNAEAYSGAPSEGVGVVVFCFHWLKVKETGVLCSEVCFPSLLMDCWEMFILMVLTLRGPRHSSRTKNELYTEYFHVGMFSELSVCRLCCSLYQHDV